MIEAIDADHEVPFKKPVVRVDGNVAQHGVTLLVDERSDVSNDTNVVLPYDFQCGGELVAKFARPLRLDDAVRIFLHQVLHVATVHAVDFNGSGTGYETHNLVAIDWIAALRELVVDAFHIVADNQDL